MALLSLRKQLVSNLSAAFIAQAMSLAASLLISLFVPKILGVFEFGFWQLFLFYCSYVGFALFGLNDGIYLIYGGKERSDINRELLTAEYLLGMLPSVCVSLIGVIFGCAFFAETQRCYVIVAVSFYLILSSIIGLFGYLLQALNEVKTYAKSVIADKALFLVFLVVLFLFGCSTFEPYVICYLISKMLAAVYCVWLCRALLKKPSLSLVVVVRETIGTMRVGINLMLANMASLFIIGISRFFVDTIWGIETFSQYSFAISLVNFFILFISQISMVAFPVLRKLDKVAIKRSFEFLGEGLSLGAPIVYVAFFPVAILLGLWLPDYSQAITLFAILLPICVFEGKMDLNGATFLKVLRKERLLLIVNVVTAFVSLFGSFVFGYYLKDLTCLCFVLVLSIAGRSIFTDLYLSNLLGVNSGKMIILDIVVTIIFEVVCIQMDYIAALVVMLTVLGIVFFINKNTIATIIRYMHKARK
ncbi:MAG: hypothetical protein RR259_10585 [Odoribacter sp.]